MKRLPFLLILAALFAAAPAHARTMDDESIAVLRMIDKLSARSSTFEVPVEKTVKFGSRLFIKVRACRKASPLETPESAAFLQIWEKPPGTEDSHWIFSGWMFASRPSASTMDNPVYDVWVIDCKNAATAAAPLTTEAAPDSGVMKNAPDSGAMKNAPDAATQADTAPVAVEKPAAEADEKAAEADTEAAPDAQKPPAEEKKAETPPEAKVFDPAAIRRDLEENAGGGISDGEDAVAEPDAAEEKN